ncbi:MAG TPA: LytTR family DNA-binding domain-containing protein [Chitinophagaceae bacterium]|nr:LytTR family DNA-binding domain-containing protein [Chitinophagaceae bacterium]
MKVIIIEDEKKAADLLQQMLFQIDPAIEIIDKCSDLTLGVKSIKKNNPDLVFLDVELPVHSGLQLLEFFEDDEINFAIIFTTASNQYAVNAFEMSAVDYLLKPLDEEKLRLAVQKFYNQQKITAAQNISVLKQNLQSPESKKIIVPVVSGFEILKVSDIIYLKAEGSYTKIFLAGNNSLTVSKNLKYFETIFELNNYFIRIHRSFIANIHLAKRIVRKDGYFLIMEDETQLPVIAEKIEEIIRFFN